MPITSIVPILDAMKGTLSFLLSLLFITTVTVTLYVYLVYLLWQWLMKRYCMLSEHKMIIWYIHTTYIHPWHLLCHICLSTYSLSWILFIATFWQYKLDFHFQTQDSWANNNDLKDRGDEDVFLSHLELF